MLLRIDGISIWYQKDRHVISDASFSLAKNQVTGLLGINGSGKTTLMNTLAGVHKKYDMHSLQFNGRETEFADNSYKMQRYIVFTEEQAFSYWNFENYLSFIHKLYKRNIDSKHLNSLIDGFGFREFTKFMLKDLSSGNKKKVFLITGFSLGLSLLILDEPLDGLDFRSSEFLYQAINAYKQTGSILMSSHIAESFEKTCDGLLLLDNGKLEEKTVEKGFDIRETLAVWRNEH